MKFKSCSDEVALTGKSIVKCLFTMPLLYITERVTGNYFLHLFKVLFSDMLSYLNFCLTHFLYELL